MNTNYIPVPLCSTIYLRGTA